MISSFPTFLAVLQSRKELDQWKISLKHYGKKRWPTQELSKKWRQVITLLLRFNMDLGLSSTSTPCSSKSSVGDPLTTETAKKFANLLGQSAVKVTGSVFFCPGNDFFIFNLFVKHCCGPKVWHPWKGWERLCGYTACGAVDVLLKTSPEHWRNAQFPSWLPNLHLGCYWIPSQIIPFTCPMASHL